MRGREIPLMLPRLASVYHGREPMLMRESGARVSVNVDGVMTPFILTTQRGTTAVEVRGNGELQAMQAEYGLAIGRVRSRLTGITLLDPDPKFGTPRI